MGWVFVEVVLVVGVVKVYVVVCDFVIVDLLGVVFVVLDVIDVI